MHLRVYGAVMNGSRVSVLGSLGLSLPWCCVVPAALALVGTGGAVGARLWLAQASWFLLPVAGILLGRAWWLAWWRRRGGGWTRAVVAASTLLVAALWVPRFATLLFGVRLGG